VNVLHAAAQFVTVSCSILALGWLAQALAAFRGVPTLPDLPRSHPSLPNPAPGSGPDVTVIVPACNEEKTIAATLRSLLASTGIRLQIVAVNDRSTDSTGAQMDAVAAEAAATPHTLEVIHNRDLPEGWLGKTHALSLAASRATAPWLLFTDGDVRFHPQAVSLTHAYAQAENADHVVLFLTMELKTIAEAAVLAAFQALSSWNMHLWKVADPKARDFFGTGGFNLVRRQVYEHLGGFEALRMQVVEDMRLAWTVKRAGFASRVVLGPGLVRIYWIQGALGIVGLLEKNGFAGLRYSIGLSLFVFLAFAADIAFPLAAIALGGWSMAAGLLAYLFIFLTYAANRRVTRISPWLALLFAPATAILLFALARSMVLALSRGGIRWRGTLYPLDELRRSVGPDW